MQDQQEEQAGSDSGLDRAVEAARYALLRRLAHAMRHHMVVHLQPIGMITEVVERRLQQPAPDLAQVQESMSKINGFSRAAVQSCLDVVSWLAPEDAARVRLDSGVAECVSLLRSNFSFRGFTLKDEVGTAPAGVARAGLRNVLPACLLALTDGTASPADVVITAKIEAPHALLSVDVRPTDGCAGFDVDKPYRLLDWSEVQALARADGIGLEREGRRVCLRLPLAV